MEMSKNYDKVKNYYDKGLWDMSRVKKAVGRWITKDEYQKITGVPYQE
ncbi:XkdX family protein [Alitiscatomonas aceti]|uniref:XkdX family protein n=1 Tax=Alitiscatomonas aceti TaxID=2981724 RepID=A0ABT2UW57_9FIRM|nr:XkdX family protein [Alitiscatomonas aceti]MCU6798890.1 XkdX family protein [Alitiscatomonas aceti]